MSEDALDANNASHSPRGTSDATLFLYAIKRSLGWLAFSAMVIAFATAGGAYLLWQQLSAAQDQLDQMSELSDQNQKNIVALRDQLAASEKATGDFSELVRQSIDVGNKQAGAATKAAEIASNAQSMLERPWVGVEAVLADPISPNQTLGLKALIRNSGKGPALNIRAVLYTAVSAVKDIKIPDVAECDSCLQPVLLPNGALNYDLVVNGSAITKDKVDRIFEGTDAILVFGRIDYTDSTDRHHSTKLCMTSLPKRSTFGACPQGNRFD